MDVNGIKYELYPNVSMISSSIGNGIVGSRYINKNVRRNRIDQNLVKTMGQWYAELSYSISWE